MSSEKIIDSWWYRTFGPVGPVISGVIMVLGILLVGLFVTFLNSFSESLVLLQIYAFLYNNLVVFFIVFLFISYGDFFSKAYPEHYWKISPFFNAITVSFLVWLLSWALSILGSLFAEPLFAGITFGDLSTFSFYLVFLVFPVVVILGYAVTFIKKQLKARSSS